MNINYKILLVDDEPDILEIISYSLENEGYSVYKAKNGIQAIEIAEKVTINSSPQTRNKIEVRNVSGLSALVV